MTGPRDNSLDAVVAGAGHNGLVAANILADAGWNVMVCKATDSIGGALRSAEVTAPGFVTDLFSAFYPLAGASPVLDRLNLPTVGLQCAHAPSVLAHVVPDGRSAVVRPRDERGAVRAVARQVDRVGLQDRALAVRIPPPADTIVAVYSPCAISI